MKKLIFNVLLLISFAQGAEAVGLQSDELKFQCFGEAKITKVKNVHIGSGFYDRAGHYHGPKGFGSYEVAITKMSPDCYFMQNKFGIDLQGQTYTHSEIIPTSILKDAQDHTDLKIGSVHKFTAEQKFSYAEADGFLPFFPIIHQETVSLKSDTISLQGGHFKVDTKNVYLIRPLEEDKLQLAEMVFSYLENPEQTDIYLPGLVLAMFENHPSFEDHFKEFIEEALVFYDQYETLYQQTPNHVSVASMLAAFGNSFSELSAKLPHYQYFDIHEVLANHPSMINNSTSFTNKKKCPNLSAIGMEKVIDELSEKFANGSIHPVHKQTWEDPIKVMVGGLWSSTLTYCIGPVTSSYTKTKAKEILELYY